MYKLQGKNVLSVSNSWYVYLKSRINLPISHSDVRSCVTQAGIYLLERSDTVMYDDRKRDRKLEKELTAEIEKERALTRRQLSRLYRDFVA